MTRLALLCSLPLLVTAGRSQDLDSSINNRPQFLDNVEAGTTEPTKVYFTLTVMFLGDIQTALSSFSIDTFIDVAWRDDRLGPESPQAFGCTPSSVGIILNGESYAPTVCEGYCDGGFCEGGAAPAPWSPFIEVTNVAPAYTVSEAVDDAVTVLVITH